MSESIEKLALRTATQGDWRIANYLELEAHRRRGGVMFDGEEHQVFGGHVDPGSGRMVRLQFCSVDDPAGSADESTHVVTDLAGRRIEGAAPMWSLSRMMLLPVAARGQYDRALLEHREGAA